MADEQEKRPWYLDIFTHARWQGAGIVLGGVAMLFNPVTVPAALPIIYWGIGWSGVGAVANKIEKLMK